MKKFKSFMKTGNGAALVEYALLVGLIAVFAIAAVFALGTNVETILNNLATSISEKVDLD